MVDFWEDDFHLCAFLAMVSEAKKAGAWPDSALVRDATCRLYEERKRG